MVARRVVAHLQSLEYTESVCLLLLYVEWVVIVGVGSRERNRSADGFISGDSGSCPV